MIQEIINTQAKIQQALEKYVQFCQACCSPESAGLNYLIGDRKFTLESILTFRLGYDSGDNQALIDFAKDAGLTKQLLLDCGVFDIGHDGKLYNKFSNRIVFPIMDLHNKVIGLQGRVFLKDDKRSKYVNTSNTMIYQKYLVLYGLAQAYSEILRTGYVIVVEGNPDVVQLHQYNYRNTVGVCGTALTDFHIKILQLFTNKIIVIFDDDEGGNSARERTKSSFQEAGVPFNSIILSGVKDPDLFLRQYGVQAFEAKINNALNLFK